MFLKNRKIITKMKRSKVTDYAALNDNSNDKNYEINNANALCEYMIILNVLIGQPISLRNHDFKKNFSGMRSEHQTVWILIRSLILSGLIWVKMFEKQ